MADVQATLRLAVRLGCIPPHGSYETGPGDVLRQIPDANLVATAKVCRFWLVVFLRSEHDRFGGICNVQELACRRPVTPGDDLTGSGAARFKALPDQRRNYMRATLKFELVRLMVKADLQAGKAPFAPGIQIAKAQLLLQAEFDVGNDARDLASHQGLGAARGLMIEKNATGGM